MLSSVGETTCQPIGLVGTDAAMRRLRALFLCPFLLFPAQVTGDGQDGSLPAWSNIQIIFTEHCIMCHGAQGAARGLRLDSYAGAMAGSDNGPVLLSGDAERSELIRRLRGKSTPRMPFLSYPLPDDQIGVIALWIDTGLREK